MAAFSTFSAFVAGKAAQGKATKTYNPSSTEDAHLAARIAEEHLRGGWACLPGSAGFGGTADVESTLPRPPPARPSAGR